MRLGSHRGRSIAAILRAISLVALPASALVALACLAGYVWVAADRVASLVLINASGHELTYRAGRFSRPISPNARLTVPPSERTQVFDLDVAELGMTWHYQLRPLDLRKYQFRGQIYLQIVSDGKVYILPHETSSPLEDLPDQPVGYPLVPEVLHGTVRALGPPLSAWGQFRKL